MLTERYKAIASYVQHAEPPVDPKRARRNLARANRCKTMQATVALAKTLTEAEKQDVMRLQAQMLREA